MISVTVLAFSACLVARRAELEDRLEAVADLGRVDIRFPRPAPRSRNAIIDGERVANPIKRRMLSPLNVKTSFAFELRRCCASAEPSWAALWYQVRAMAGSGVMLRMSCVPSTVGIVGLRQHQRRAASCASAARSSSSRAGEMSPTRAGLLPASAAWRVRRHRAVLPAAPRRCRRGGASDGAAARPLPWQRAGICRLALMRGPERERDFIARRRCEPARRRERRRRRQTGVGPAGHCRLAAA